MKRPQVGITVAIVKDGKILFGKRLKPYGYGKYQLPGGHLEMFESFEERAHKEVLEETGLKIDRLKHLSTINCFDQDLKIHYVSLLFGAAWDSGEIFISEEERNKVESWDWYDPKNPPKPRFEIDNVNYNKIKEYVVEEALYQQKISHRKTVNWLIEIMGISKTDVVYDADLSDRSMVEIHPRSWESVKEKAKKLGKRFDSVLGEQYEIVTPFNPVQISLYINNESTSAYFLY